MVKDCLQNCSWALHQAKAYSDENVDFLEKVLM